jgi:hypothetical protein
MSHILRMATMAVMLAFAATGVAQARGGLAKSHKHAGYAAPLPVIVVRPTTERQFITVGPNGYWVTTTWGCWVDDGQGRIHDCDGQ